MRRSAIAALAAVIALGAAVSAAVETVTLPTSWRIAKHAGPVAAVGTLPTGMALSADGRSLVELETGYRKPALRVLDGATLAEIRHLDLSSAYGAPLRDPDGDGVWFASPTNFEDEIAHVDTARGTIDRAVTLPLPFGPAALARSPRGLLAVAGDLGSRVAFVDPVRERLLGTVGVSSHPAALAFSPDGGTLFVAARAGAHLDVVDVAHRRLAGRIAVGLHPSALLAAGGVLYVADTDDDDIAVVDIASRRLIARVPLPFAERGIVGASPNALLLAGGRLYVTCGAANAIAVYRVRVNGRLEALGAIPTGWYPTAVAVDTIHGALFVADGKGEGGRPNPMYEPNAQTRTGEGWRAGYVANQLTGTIRRYAIPDDAAVARGLAEVKALAERETLESNPIVRPHGPITHVVYVIKENRTYDQVLGDIAGADGDPALVLFGERVTPNQHALARRFGTFDRFFEDAHVSADGHNWATAAFANDYLERMWPAEYAGRRPYYDFEDGATAAQPHAGYLWDNAARHGVSMRNYGEFVASPPAGRTPVTSMNPTLLAHTDRRFPSYDLSFRDVARYDEWKREFDVFERDGTLPALEVVRFPNDHTAGTSAGSLTPQAMVADNDLAVGRLVQAVSHSRYWPSTAIFVVEDDAQDGPDHVDAQRSTFYLISPYAAGGVLHERYTQASVLRTIEVLLGLSPMSPYDAGARALTSAFRAVPDLRPFDALPAVTDVDAKNGAAAYRAADSARLNLARSDAVDPAEFNDILWHAVKGAKATPPPYGTFRR